MSFPDVRAVVLAGGFGTRIQHLLPDRPKPMAEVAGRPFLEWVLLFLKKCRLRNFCVSTGYRASFIAEHFAARPISGTQIQCIPETTPLGTAGGFLHCVSKVSPPPDIWLVTNGDSLAIAPLQDLIALMNDPMTDGAVLGVEMADASRYGSLRINPDGRLVGFAEKQPGRGVINAGVYLFRHSLLAGFPVERPLSFESEVFPGLLQRANIKALATAAPFLDIGTPSSLAQAETFISSHLNCFEL